MNARATSPVIGLMALLIPFVTAGATVEEMLEQVRILQGQIQVMQNQAVTISASPTTPGLCITINQNLSFGKSGTQVSALQKFLAQDPQMYPEGQVTGYFGPATLRAIKRWQSAKGIVSTGTPETTGFGVVGPLTRSALSCARSFTAVPAPLPRDPMTGAWGHSAPIGWIDIAPLKATSTTPTLSGTVSDASIFGVSSARVVIRTFDPSEIVFDANVTVTNGRWSVKVSPALTKKQYRVDLYAPVDAELSIASGTLIIDAVVNTTEEFSVNPQTGIAPMTVTFSGVVNSAGYSVDYGDGTSSGDQGCGHGSCPSSPQYSNVEVTHTYQSPGTYTAKLRKHFGFVESNCTGVDCNVVGTVPVYVD